MQGLPQSRPQGPPLITAAPVMGIMLGLLTGCDDADERLATLTTLKRLVGQPHMCLLLADYSIVILFTGCSWLF